MEVGKLIFYRDESGFLYLNFFFESLLVFFIFGISFFICFKFNMIL